MLTHQTAINVVYRQVESRFEFLVHDYQSVDPDTEQLSKPEIRFPSGTSGSGELGETSEETSIRKLKQETGLVALDTEEIARKKGEHPKHAFLINYQECLGELFTEPIRINGDEMSAPYWVSVKELAGKISPPHFWVYRAAVERLREG